MSAPGPENRDKLRERIAIAIDRSSAAETMALAHALEGRVGWLKVGLQLFTAEGGAVVRDLTRAGNKVFLDLKLHDIPTTVSAAAVEAMRLGAAMINLHASGGLEMMRAAAESLAREARRGGRKRPRLLAVTALTSLGDLDLASIGLLGPAEELVVRLAALARRAGCDGVVCSPREASLVRARCGAEFFIVTPGIRPAFAPGAGAGEDQKRTSTPAEALSAGADLIVIGRPVTGARDPAAAVERILDEIAGSAVRMP